MNKKSKNILYIGNDRVIHKDYHDAMQTLYGLLKQNGYVITKSSAKKNSFLRLLDMCGAILNNRKKVDIVLIDTFSTLNFYYALITSQLCRLLGIPYICILHGGNLPNRLSTSTFLSNLIFKHAAKNVSPSKYLQKAFLNAGYACELIPNSINLEDYHFIERVEVRPKLLYVRAFAKIYNPKMAVDVLQQLKHHYPTASLCMVGPDRDGSLKEVKEYIQSKMLEDSIIIKGALKREEWHQLSTQYDLFINTSNFDNQPVSIIEALALGLRVISTNVGGIPYLIRDKSDGLLVDAGDVQAMTQAVMDSIKGKYPDMSKNMRVTIQEYDNNQVAKKWKTLIDKV